MAFNTRRLRSSQVENEVKLNHIKINKVDNVQQPTRRPALGDLGNRAKNCNNVQEIIKTDIQGLKTTNLKQVKPRVDTHWKKTTSGVTAVGPAPVRKTSKETIKIDKKTLSSAISNNENNIQKPAIAVTKLVKVKASTIAKPVLAVKAQLRKEKSNENVVYQNQQDHQPNEQKTKKTASALVRQESILTRRSLGNKIQQQPQQQNAKEKIVIRKPSTDNYSIAFNDPLTNRRASHSTFLIDEVINIDENDHANPLLLSIYVNDIYNYFYDIERKSPIIDDHLKNQKEVTPKMRAVLIDWINEVHYQFHLVLETFHMTVSIIDRYLQATTDTAKQNLQLVGVTALYLASKYEELYPPELSDFEYITDNTYNKKQILRMEMSIAKVLEFELGNPLSIHFLRRYSKATNTKDSTLTTLHHTMAKYFIELATVDYNLAKYLPSEIAAASLYLSLKLLSNKSDTSFWTPTLNFYTSYTIEHLRPIVRQLAEVVQSAPNSKLKAVYNKYKLVKFDQISLRSELRSIDLNDF